jgi:hypothetical protein
LLHADFRSAIWVSHGQSFSSNGEKVNGEKVNGEKVNGEKVNGEKVNGEKVNGEKVEMIAVSGQGTAGNLLSAPGLVIEGRDINVCDRIDAGDFTEVFCKQPFNTQLHG